MANILSKEQSEQIRRIRTRQKELNLNGWMCEGADDDLFVAFNNDTQQSFSCDYYGNIQWAIDKNDDSFELSEELKEFARLEGMICRIAYLDERIKED